MRGPASGRARFDQAPMLRQGARFCVPTPVAADAASVHRWSNSMKRRQLLGSLAGGIALQGRIRAAMLAPARALTASPASPAPSPTARAAWRGGVAYRSGLGATWTGGGGPFGQGNAAARSLSRGTRKPCMRRNFQAPEEPLFSARRGGAYAVARLGGCLDLATERIRCDRSNRARRRHGRPVRAGEQSEAGREGGRTQLPGDIQRA
jgi:hypothetical protein